MEVPAATSAPPSPLLNFIDWNNLDSLDYGTLRTFDDPVAINFDYQINDSPPTSPSIPDEYIESSLFDNISR